jgi:hypothetical protein
VDGGEFLNQPLALGRKFDMSLSSIGLASRARDQFSLDQTIDDVDGRMVFDLKSLAELGNDDASVR